MVKKIAMILVLAMLAASLVGCNTVKGVGEDIKAVGEAGEEAVD